MESANINFDEHAKVHVEEPKKLDEYKTFIYSYEGMAIENSTVNKVDIQSHTQ